MKKQHQHHQRNLSSSLGSAWEPPVGSRRSASSQPGGGTGPSSSRNTPDSHTGSPKPAPTSSKPAKRRSPEAPTPPPPKMSSQRNRPRDRKGNSESGTHGEEFQLWNEIQKNMPAVISSFNESSSNILDIRDQDKVMAEKRDQGTLETSDYSKLDNLLRKGVKANDAAGAEIPAMIEQLKVLRAVIKAKEQEQEQTSSSRSSTQRVKESAAAAASSSVYDFDGAGESTVPSPNPTVSRRMGGSASKGDRDSVPPKVDRSTPSAKAGSVEPQNGSASSIARSKMSFSKDDEVAFRPKPTGNEQTDWILGIVQEVRGEGKSRRYRVLDADVDESGNQKDFRTSASSMILIPPEGSVLAPLDAGKTVLALYPHTTTFYKAEVIGMEGEDKVNLKFEGEESSNTMQAVGRRHVVEYRG
ncbi:SGF29 tudor-like domain-containing protein [Microdochium trichocladiopsis]|uniref:SGF29 tudor-like domain-containing protein n=1 Tax=Microdochium trichocladiopsis TaxID=1682393 RepID=A0A9P8XYZ8_9PEZI|nr:SGF29 tudor-like domain-containing protein [Microdochium trichocladiopsis]KAH7025713.1 SGF29 tudor-like domain-containing protein [Microdochium trichocladiopsis]